MALKPDHPQGAGLVWALVLVFGVAAAVVYVVHSLLGPLRKP